MRKRRVQGWAWPLAAATLGLLFLLCGIVQWQRSGGIRPVWALDTQAGNGLAIYAQNGDQNPKWRTYASSTNTFGAEASAIIAGIGRTFRLRTSPVQQEAVAGYVSSTGALQVLCYNGTAWTREWSVNVGGPGATTTRFDIAYESNTGDALVVYSANAVTTNELRYRTKSGGTGCGSNNWSAEQTFNPARTSGIVHWVKMASDPRTSSNLIATSWADHNRDLSAAIWDGSAFTNEPVNPSSANLEIITTAQDIDPFDIEYESLSGDALFAWSTSTGSDIVNSIAYRTCTGGTSACTWGNITAMPTVANEGSAMDLAANPGSNEIVFGSMSNAGQDVQAAWWSGTAWTAVNDVDTSGATPTSGTHMLTAGWVTWGSASRSVIVYNDSAATNIGYVSGTNGLFTAGTDATPSPVFGNPQKWYNISMNPFERHKLMLTVQDTNSDVFAKRLFYNGSAFTWTNADGGAALENTLPPGRILSLSAFDHWRFIPVPTSTQDVYRWFANLDSANVGATLAAQNTTAVLTTDGQAFRLRLLLRVGKNMIPDDLGQTFKLQFVDKGAGTCASPSGGTPAAYTDVTASTAIAFNDNASVADGVVLTANAGDPTDGGRTIVNQTYKESNPFLATQSSILSGQDGKWDFSLIDDAAPDATTYCFRVVYNSGSALEAIAVYPEITTASGGGISADIVDAAGSPVASPFMPMATSTVSFSVQTATGTLGVTNQRIRVTNSTGSPNWSLSIAASSTAAVWDGAVADYDYNDPTANGADGADADAFGGQLRFIPNQGSITPEGGCTATGVSLEPSTNFSEGVRDSLTLATAGGSADTGCYWDLMGIAVSSTIPANQPAGAYFIHMVITALAV